MGLCLLGLISLKHWLLGTFIPVFQQITQDRYSVLTDVLRDSEVVLCSKM